MNKWIDILKGLHPGIFLERELKKRNISKIQFARSIHEYPQTLSAIMKGKRSINTSLALRMEQALGFEEGFFVMLQAYYDIRKEKEKQQQNHLPDLSKIRRILFWDTSMDKINWDQHKGSIIRRVFERGNLTEKKEIISFYGKETVRHELSVS